MAHEPIFKAVFGESWNELPPVMINHYANKPYSNDRRRAEGTMDLKCKWFVLPLFRLLGTVPSINETDIPVTVDFSSEGGSQFLWFRRQFNLKNGKPYKFNSRMEQISGNEVAERMKNGICWHAKFTWDGEQVLLTHAGYSICLGNRRFSLPITWLMGRGDAYEVPIDENKFDMCATLKHPLFGLLYEYKGRFEMVAIT